MKNCMKRTQPIVVIAIIVAVIKLTFTKALFLEIRLERKTMVIDSVITYIYYYLLKKQMGLRAIPK